ncbi:TIGR04104 family putative zinc finger protein [Virgibacillus necropolis]|uniref:TIGR04104 family putative zinc finger protein n=1 Tax=Virgibacillus necropolis TaxID=163877 RepID=UPI001D056F73
MIFVLRKCVNCNKQSSWYKIYKYFLWLHNKSIECDNCGAEHKISIPGRFAFVSLTVIPAIIFMNYLSPFGNFFVTLGIGIVILTVGSLLTPYFVEFKEAV